MFTATFLKNEGISALANLIPQCTGNTLAYCLDSLDTCMNYGMGWQNVDQNVLQTCTRFSPIRTGRSVTQALKASKERA